MKINPLLLQDSYKIGHHQCYAQKTNKVYSNFTPRSGKRSKNNHTVFFGLQYFIKRFLIEEFNQWFSLDKIKAVNSYKRLVDAHLGVDFNTDHLEKLHDLGYLPLKIKALQEGAKVPYGIPVLTITNTLDDFYWLPNFLETLLSNSLWYLCTSAANSYTLKQLMLKYSNETCDNNSFVDYQLHDFSFRGHHTSDSGIIYGAAWGLNFKGSDCFPAISWLEHYYNADINDTLNSVIATEHSIACSYGKENELEYIKNMIENVCPNGIVSIVADTWSFPRFVTKLLPLLKNSILNRNGKVVIRPDSFWTNPQDCLCGYNGWHDKMSLLDQEELQMVKDGAIKTLYNMFGGSYNSKGFIELNQKIGIIYGEALFYDRLEEICQRLKNDGFASNNFVGGVGSWTALNTNRDQEGWAMKATYCEVDGIPREIFKDPITDDGTKKSLKGLLYVGEKDGKLFVEDQVSVTLEQEGLLTEVFIDGKIVRETSLSEIRSRLN